MVFVIRTASGVFALRKFFDVHALRFEFGFEQCQLFFSDLFTKRPLLAASNCRSRFSVFDPSRFGSIQLCDQIEHHLLQNIRALGQLFAVDRHLKTLSPEDVIRRYSFMQKKPMFMRLRGVISPVSLPALRIAQVDA